ncbi:MAG: 3-deoxy-7-phosphoheptulonate synthase [Myxococcota bacterium]|nr:3-deoxy-7-phosphoheptulonate synthase [Myxococcota bacterium]
MSKQSPSSISNVRVTEFDLLRTPRELASAHPLNDEVRQVVADGRRALRECLAGTDRRLVVIVGPCSIHDPRSALEYATRLAGLREQVADKMMLVMRVYFEKPRTTVGWKGLITDPDHNGSDDMNRGLEEARKILLAINGLGLPCATEFLDPIVPQYVADLVSWAAIGARTTESQTHRQMASGLSMPVGFKNSTDGGLEVAVQAMEAASAPHAFLGINVEGQTSVVRTTGNPDTHVVRRGGGGKSNYSRADIAYTRALLGEADAGPRAIMVDCSHANSGKDYRKQPVVFGNVIEQVLAGEEALLGMMLESHLVEGRQALGESMTYGQSVTDACIGWETTEELLLGAHERLSA